MRDMVSVVVPTFNRPDLLDRAVQSVLNQSFKHFEVIIVNDGDEIDPVAGVVKRLNDPRVIFLNNNRKKGANGARNTGILAAQGAYIAFLDDDDEWLPGKLWHQVEYLENHLDKCGVFNEYTIKNKSVWRKKTYNISTLTIGDVLLSKVSIGSSSNLFFRTEVLKTAGLWDEDLIRQQDLELLLRILSIAEIGFQKTLAVKVYGHSDLHPRKALRGYEEYNEKVQKYLEQLSSGKRNKYYSIYFRRMSMCHIKLREFKIAFELYKRALKFEIIDPKRDIKNLLLLIRQVNNGETSHHKH